MASIASAPAAALGATITAAVVEAPSETRPALAPLLASDARITVTGTAGHADALELLRTGRPQVLVVGMTRASTAELETVRGVMATRPLPIVVCVPDAEQARERVLEAGAVACVEAPGAHAPEASIAALRQAVRLMAEVRVVRRWPRGQATPHLDTGGQAAVPPAAFAHPPAEAAPANFAAPPRPAAAPAPAQNPAFAMPGLPSAVPGLRVVGIGTSTGGPAALKVILCGLPPSFPLPILVVQHIASGFLAGMADWLTQSCQLPVQVPRFGEMPLPGHVYLAPDGVHMGVGPDGRIVLAHEPSPTALCPSVAYLFRTLAEVHGPRAVGVLLTGMGKDGAAGLKLMKDRGAVTIAQDRDSSVVHGMPAAAIALGAASHIIPAGHIAAALAAIAGVQISDKGSSP